MGKTKFIYVTLVGLICLSFISAAFAQDAVPGEILNRTFPIKVGSASGTAFTIDYQGKLYLITARHIVTGLPESKERVQVQRANRWLDIRTTKILFPESKDVDIAIFETDEKVAQPFKVTTEGKVSMGQDVWFLGYPFGLGPHFQFEIVEATLD